MPAPDVSRLRRATVCAIVFDNVGRLLLHRRTDNGKWALPGGAIEVGERADEATEREVKEETGYRVEVVRLVGIYSDPKHTTIRYPEGDVNAYVAIAFECKVLGGDRQLSDESAAVEWFDPQNVPEDFYPGHVPRLRDALAKKEAAFFR